MASETTFSNLIKLEPEVVIIGPSQKNWVLGIFRLGQTFGSGLGDCWDVGLGLGLGLDNKNNAEMYNRIMYNVQSMI